MHLTQEKRYWIYILPLCAEQNKACFNVPLRRARAYGGKLKGSFLLDG